MRSEDSDAKALLSPENRERFGIHYLGLSLILAWYYCLWFSPSMFSTLPITDDAVTFSWLSTLALTGFAFLTTPFVFTKVHIYKQPIIMWVASAATCIATMAFGAFGTILNNLVFGFIVFPVIFAAGNAIMWVAWGELHAIRKSNFSLHKFSLSSGITMFIAMSVTTLLPHIASNIFVALLPLLSAMLYRKSNEKFRDKELPTLLPKATRAKTSRATFFISIAISITCVACYYNIAIIPIDQLLPDGMSYVAGIIGSAVVCLLLSLVQKLTKKEIATYRLLPWVVVACCAALGLYANGDPALYNVSFIITITLAGIFELFLVSYFGALSNKGHLAPVMAFAVSGAVVRLGFFFGDGWAIVYERNPFLAEHFSTSTSIFFLCLLAMVLVPLLRQESAIIQLTKAPAASSEIEEVCNAAIEEFSLSKREGEILKYIARGYTIDNISKKLVISPYTTQTHVRHIYSKMNVHKRSELLDYINMHRSDA